MVSQLQREGGKRRRGEAKGEPGKRQCMEGVTTKMLLL